jgi:hypothetical protein
MGLCGHSKFLRGFKSRPFDRSKKSCCPHPNKISDNVYLTELLVEADVGAPGVERPGEAGNAAPRAVEVVRHHLNVVHQSVNRAVN